MYQSNIEILDSLSTLDHIWYEKKDVINRRTDTKVVLSVAAGWPNIPTSKCLTIRFFKRSKVKKSAT